jgi:hypothetical protein
MLRKCWLAIAFLGILLTLNFGYTILIIHDASRYYAARSLFMGFGLIQDPLPPPPPFPSGHPNYEDFLKFISDPRFNVYPVCQYKTAYRSDKINIILRHDVDSVVAHTTGYGMANLEEEYGIKSTYYLRLHSNSNAFFDSEPKGLMPDDRGYDIRTVIPFYQSLQAKGYEIGYHYEMVDMFLFSNDTARLVFQSELNYLRQYFTICSASAHGGTFNYQFEEWGNITQYGLISPNEIGVPVISDCCTVIPQLGPQWKTPDGMVNYFAAYLNKLKPGDVVEILIHPDYWFCADTQC